MSFDHILKSMFAFLLAPLWIPGAFILWAWECLFGYTGEGE